MAKLTDEQVRILAQVAKEELGPDATLEKMRQVVSQAVDRLESQEAGTADTERVGRALAICISTDGLRNSRTLTEALRDTGCRVLERFEKNLSGFFTLLAIIDVSNCANGYDLLRQRLSDTGNRENVRITLQTKDALWGRANKI